MGFKKKKKKKLHGFLTRVFDRYHVAGIDYYYVLKLIILIANL